MRTLSLTFFSVLALMLFAYRPATVRTGPALDPALHAPPLIAAFLHRSCADCHSNATKWPWYANVPPASWIVRSDVDKARRVLNFSEWSIHASQPEIAMGALAGACADLRTQRMPKGNYLWLHPEAKPSNEEITGFCAWTAQQIAQLSQSKAKAQ